MPFDHRLPQATRCLARYVGAPCIGRADIALLPHVTRSGEALGCGGRATSSASVIRSIGEVSPNLLQYGGFCIVFKLTINERSPAAHWFMNMSSRFAPASVCMLLLVLTSRVCSVAFALLLIWPRSFLQRGHESEAPNATPVLPRGAVIDLREASVGIRLTGRYSRPATTSVSPLFRS